jgi:DNA-binding GntR family transcriptional regulator
MSPTAVDRVAGVLREQILDAQIEAGTRLVEADLVERHGAARHTVRAALRALADEGLVAIAPNRGARVAGLDGDAIAALYELRAALEVEAAHLALARHGDRLPPSVHEAAEVLARACGRPRPRWSTVSRAHADLHTSLVRLFLLQVRPHYTFAQMGAEHQQLLRDLETHGPEVLRTHLRVAAGSVVDGVPRTG